MKGKRKQKKRIKTKIKKTKKNKETRSFPKLEDQACAT